MAMYYNGHKVKNLYFNGKCITRLALGKEMTRLVEGDDFVRAEWLKGDGEAYIELDNQFNTDKNAFISAKFKQYSSRNNGYDIVIGKNVSMDGYCIRVSFSTVIFYDLHKVVNGVANSFRKTKSIDTEEHNVYMSFSNLIVDNVDVPIIWGEQFDASMNIKNTRIYSGYAKYKELTIRTNNQEFNLTPVRLLRPLPATLDANGIARNAGDCGMYDAVSGKFYGNVGSGAFTVEPSLVEGVDYEEHKWLIGDGSAYIQGIEYDLWNNHLQARIGRSNDRINYFSYSGNGNDNGYLNVSPSPKSGGWYLMFVFRQTASPASHIGDIDPISSVPNTLDLEFYIDNSIFYCKQNGVINENAPQTSDALQSSWTSITPIIPSNKVSYIRELLPDNTYRSNLTPVRLLRPLPSYLDANGKARKQFECGMLDLKTMKFYGNVATSGKFTVSDN